MQINDGILFLGSFLVSIWWGRLWIRRQCRCLRGLSCLLAILWCWKLLILLVNCGVIFRGSKELHQAESQRRCWGSFLLRIYKHWGCDYRYMMVELRLVVFWVVGVQGGCLELILSVFYLQISIFPTDDIEFTHHFRMLCQVIRIHINS